MIPSDGSIVARFFRSLLGSDAQERIIEFAEVMQTRAARRLSRIHFEKVFLEKMRTKVSFPHRRSGAVKQFKQQHHALIRP
jgi:hypothetical protein